MYTSSVETVKTGYFLKYRVSQRTFYRHYKIVRPKTVFVMHVIHQNCRWQRFNINENTALPFLTSYDVPVTDEAFQNDSKAKRQKAKNKGGKGWEKEK